MQIESTTVYSAYDFTGRYHLTDSLDALPPDVVSMHEGTLDVTEEALRQAIEQTEATGTDCLIQVGDFYYETSED